MRFVIEGEPDKATYPEREMHLWSTVVYKGKTWAVKKTVEDYDSQEVLVHLTVPPEEKRKKTIEARKKRAELKSGFRLEQ